MGHDSLFPPRLQTEIRNRFVFVDHDPYSGKRIFFENAGGSLALKSAIDAHQAQAGLADNIGRRTPTSAHLGQLLDKGLADARLFFNAQEGVVFGGESTTGNLCRIVEAIVAGRKGTNVVCTELDHASLYDATRFFANRHGLEWRVARLDPATGAVPAEAIARCVDQGTILVGVIHASNITGVKNDLPEIVAAVRRRNADTLLLVDGAQHAQHGIVDVAALNIDAYVFAPYKVFAGHGIAFAYVGPRVAELPHPRLLGKPAGQWELGTRNPAGYVGFSATVDYLCWLGEQVQPTGGDRRQRLVAGMEAIAGHEHALMERLLHGGQKLPGLLANPKVRILGCPHAGPEREAVFAVTFAGLSALRFVERALDAGIAVHDRQNDAYSGHTLRALGVEECVRISLAHYNTPAEIDAFLEFVRHV